MRAAILNDARVLEVGEVADPTPGPGELVLRVTACGICGSDLKIRPAMPSGLVLGHEFCGEVVAVGSEAAGQWREGQHVAALPVIGCGHCLACLAGEPAQCEQADLVGVGGSPGGFAEYVRVDGRETFALPESIAPELGALVEPLAVGRHAVERSVPKAGDRVLVVGAGPVGLAVTTWLSQFGVRELVVSDPSAERRTAAEQFGATRTVDPTAEKLEPRYDLVFECVGLPGMTDVCTAAAVRHGKVVIAGVCAGSDPYRPVTAVMKELSIDFVVYYTRREFSSVIEALAGGAVDAAPFVTQKVGLASANDAFDLLTSSKEERKILVLPELG
jgi:(R,R)-butanediol dehydrogenase / meso-butanediol dehydrogenase / diacetyl reductase